jgi:hypothetical protein
MKTIRFALLLAAGTGLLFAPGCSKPEEPKAQSVSQDVERTARDAATEVRAAAITTWHSIKDYGYERRADFIAAVNRMAGALEGKVRALPESTAPERAAAVREFNEARADLKASLDDLAGATSDTWADAKARVDAAWQRVNKAYIKATS